MGSSGIKQWFWVKSLIGGVSAACTTNIVEDTNETQWEGSCEGSMLYEMQDFPSDTPVWKGNDNFDFHEGYSTYEGTDDSSITMGASRHVFYGVVYFRFPPPPETTTVTPPTSTTLPTTTTQSSSCANVDLFEKKKDSGKWKTCKWVTKKKEKRCKKFHKECPVTCDCCKESSC